jgi:hypothetical protein
MISCRIHREAREAVIAARFRGEQMRDNPYSKGSRRHLYWEMGVRRAEIAAADLLRIGA